MLLVSYLTIHCQDCQGDFPMFSSRSFMVSGLTLKSLINFELIFVSDLRYISFYVVSFFCIWLSSFLNTIVWRDCLFPIECCWFPCQILVDCIFVGLFLGFSFYFIGICVFLCHTGFYHTVLIIIAFQYSLKSGSVMTPTFFFVRLLWLCRVFCGSIQILGFFFFL